MICISRNQVKKIMGLSKGAVKKTTDHWEVSINSFILDQDDRISHYRYLPFCFKSFTRENMFFCLE